MRTDAINARASSTENAGAMDAMNREFTTTISVWRWLAGINNLLADVMMNFQISIPSKNPERRFGLV